MARVLLPQDDAPAVRQALTQGLDRPLAALRISLESLAVELRRESVGRPLIEGLLGQIERLESNVRELVDYAAPLEPRLAACTVRELGKAVRQRLEPEERERFDLATCGVEFLWTDLPVLARIVERLVRNSFEAGSAKALLVVRAEGNEFHVAVIDRALGGFDASEPTRPFRTTKPNHLGLGLALAERDARALGGHLEVEASPLGSTRVRLVLPRTPGTPESSS